MKIAGNVFFKDIWTGLGGRPGLGGAGGHSAFLQVINLKRNHFFCVVSHPWPTFHFLQKRLGKGQKFFDSGDYQMAKQVNFQWFWWSRVHLFLLSVKQSVPLREVQVAWGQGCLSWPNPLAQVSLPEKSKKSPFIRTGVAHPTPDTVPARKSSIIQVLSKDMKNYFERIFYYFSCRG